MSCGVDNETEDVRTPEVRGALGSGAGGIVMRLEMLV